VVAAEARISKPLIYKYFPRLADLFKALVEREYRFLRGRGLGVLPKNAPYEEVIHHSNLRSMEYLYERGPIMRLLASDRSIAGLRYGAISSSAATMLCSSSTVSTRRGAKSRNLDLRGA